MLSNVAVELEGHIICPAHHPKPGHHIRPYSQFLLIMWLGSFISPAMVLTEWRFSSLVTDPAIRINIVGTLRRNLNRIYMVHVCHAGSTTGFIIKSTEKARPRRTWQKPRSGLGIPMCTLKMGSRA
jgi:hypothetical protein